MTEELKLVEQCYDPLEYGYLHGFNRKLTPDEEAKIKDIMTKFKPATFKNVMQISGDPHGWMCTEEDIQKVEKALGITNTVEKRRKQQQKQQEIYDKTRHIKEEALEEIEKIYAGAPRPPQKLDILLKVAQQVYDPANSFRDNRFYGGGQLFIVTKKSIWYVINNSQEGNDTSINNIQIDDEPAAIGFKAPYTEHLHELIQKLTENNHYKDPIEDVE
ncbi:MAG: hypothetical protein SOZ23_06945 [Methanosphaera sp.]|uniref:hypothetical protein n=1 Tax=Methanosphaera sp. TaxID=2666342 RepID=UPI0025F6FFCD|nr:hypothetical protein [Methanosphaera sp.]MCI5867500.1 hypothetical protein [Methanosphaera sp.]MDD6533896.1 hypothetical protein [Methanosphaera sp.]MDY3956496.1 hypothetical protein [Methanosphaera sp.]